MSDRRPYRAPAEPDLGRAIATFRRSAGQNLGVVGFVAFFFALPAALAWTARSPGGYVLAGTFALAACLPAALIARQIVPNWNVCWVLYERGFTRTRRGQRERFTYEQVAAVCIRPMREALVQLQDARQLLIEGLAGSDELAAQLEQAVSRVALARYTSLVQAGGEAVLGRVAIGATGVRVDDTWFDWGELSAEAVNGVSAVRGEQVETWVFTSRDETRRAEVPITAIPLPTVARTLIADGIARASDAVTPDDAAD